MKKLLLQVPSLSPLPKYKKLLFAFLLFFGISFAVQAQTVAAYTYSETSVGTYSPITGTDLFGATPDDNETPLLSQIPIGFTFNFKGTNYTQLRASANGFIAFGGTTVLPKYSVISGTDDFAGAVSGFSSNNSSRDLVYSSYPTTPVGGVLYSAATYPSSVEYSSTGTVGSRVFTIQYKNMVIKTSSSSTTPFHNGLINFQIKLYEGSGTIQVIHNNQTVSPSGGFSGGTSNAVFACGLRGSVNTDFNTRVANSAWSSTTFGNATTGLNYKNTSYCNAVMTMTWTAPCYQPTSLTVGSITTTAALIGWTAPVTPPASYDYEIRNLSGTAIASGNITGVSTTATGLADGTTYTLYLKSSCTTSWVTGPSFTTLCGVKTIPYSRNFNEGDYTVPAIPNCLSIQNMGSGNNWTTSGVTASSTTALFTTNHVLYDSTVGVGATQNANVWLFTPALSLTTGVTYKLSYDYGGSTESPTIVNKMLVSLGTAASNAGMTITLVDHSNIKASPLSNSISFTVSSTGSYYIGFKAYSDMNNGRLFLDNIQVTQPGCIQPTGLTVGAITSNSATATWTVPTPAPGNGYEYYLTAGAPVAATAMTNGTVYQIVTVGTTNYTSFGSGSNVIGTIFTANGPGTGTGVVSAVPSTPSYTQLVTGATSAGTNLLSMTGLTGSTAYYLWVRGNCGTNDASQWSTMQSFVTLAPLVYCLPSASSSASYISNFTTTGGSANIANTSGFTGGGYANYTAQVVKQVAGGSVSFSMKNSDTGLGAGMTGWVDWNNSGTFTNSGPDERFYINTTGDYIFGGPATGTINVPGGQALGNYRMRIMSDYIVVAPTNPCAFGGTRGEVEDYTFTVIPPPQPLALNITSASLCAGTNTPLITITPATIGNYQVYTWSPSTGVGGTSGSGYTINTSTTQTFTLTGFNTTTFQTNTVSFVYTATQPPTAISVAPATTSQCQNAPAVQLVSTGGTIPGFTVLAEDFNTTALGTLPTFVNATTPAPTVWTSTNTGSGGTNPVSNASFNIRPAGYDPTWSVPLVSNDNSQFAFTDGDSQGNGSINNVTLVSPVFSLPSATYSSALLSFWHYFKRYSSGDIFIGVEISTDGGSTWAATLQSYTADQGTPTSFSPVSINLNSYIGQTNLRIRFRFNANWGYGWAIDNFLISAAASSNTTWNTQTSPVATGVAVPGLYTNAGATTAYIAGDKTTSVYASPTTTTTYVASASTITPSVCTVSATAVVNITPIFGGVITGNQIVCGAAPADLTLANSIGTIQWQYADDSAFTIGLTNAGTGTTTLTSAQMGGILAADRYFRAQLTVGGCTTAYSNTVSVLTSAATSTWTGGTWVGGTPTSGSIVVFDSNFTSSINAGPSGDVSACSVVVSNGANVLFDKGTLSVQNKVNVSSGTLSFSDKASLYQVTNFGNSPGVYSGGNTGNISYDRVTTPLFKFDYTYWSTPVYPQNLLAVSPLSPTSLFYEFNTNWVNIGNPAATTMTPAKGYIFRAPTTFPVSPATPQAYTATFTGVPNNGTITIPVVGGASQMNLFGNPYPSALSADAFLADTDNTSLGGSIYLWTHNTPINASYQYSGSDYAIYNYIGGVGTGTAATNPGLNVSVPNGKIASGQGFFVKGLSTGTASFKNTMRVTGNNDRFFKNSNAEETVSGPEKHRYWVDITNSQGAFKEILIGYVDGGTLGLDRLYDAEMVDVGNVITLYTTVENTKLSIQGRPLPFDVNETLPLGYKSTIASTYTINLQAHDGLFDSQKVYLEDTTLNTVHDLTVSPYTFVTEIGTFNDRFKLLYTTTALGTDNPEFNSNSVIVYKNENGLNINSGSAIMQTVTIFDIQGRVLSVQNEVGSTDTIFTTLPLTNQILLVKIVTESGATVTKKIVY